MEGAEPRRLDRIQTPEKPLAGHTVRPAFPVSGKPRFSRVVPLFPVLVYRRFSGERQPQKIVVSCFARNAGHAVRPANNFLRAAKQTGVQQHPKNTQKRLFRQAAAPSEREPFRFALARQPSSTTAYDRLATTFKTFSTGPWDASGVTAIANASITGQPTFSAGWSFI